MSKGVPWSECLQNGRLPTCERLSICLRKADRKRIGISFFGKTGDRRKRTFKVRFPTSGATAGGCWRSRRNRNYVAGSWLNPKKNADPSGPGAEVAKCYGHESVNSALLPSPDPGLNISIRCHPASLVPDAIGPRVHSVVTVCIPASVKVMDCSGEMALSLRSHLYLTVAAPLV